MDYTINYNDGGLAFGAVWVGSFANGSLVPYLTVITGIAFWLRIARIISDIPGVSEKMVYLGRNTYSVMMHHVAVFMLIKGICYLCSYLTPFCGEFEQEMFFHDIGYVYLMGGTEASKWIYLIMGIGVPLIVKEEVEKMKKFGIQRFKRSENIFSDK